MSRKSVPARRVFAFTALTAILLMVQVAAQNIPAPALPDTVAPARETIVKLPNLPVVITGSTLGGLPGVAARVALGEAVQPHNDRNYKWDGRPRIDSKGLLLGVTIGGSVDAAWGTQLANRGQGKVVPSTLGSFNTCIAVMALGAVCNGGADGENAASLTAPMTVATENRVAPADYDADGKTDVALKDNRGNWRIDFASNEFARWDQSYGARGYANAHPVPADYDGDKKADLSVKTDAGEWFIDYAADGIGAWNVRYTAYGFANAHPVPADYDGDGRADLSIKADDGGWLIDYAADGFGGWNATYSGYGYANAHPVPADYDGDKKSDLSVKTDAGEWFIDYAADGFGAWNVRYTAYGFANAHPVPADYDGDGRADLSIKADDGGWLIDYAADGFGRWNAMYSGYGYADAHAVPADYDGDKKADLAVMTDYGYWFIDLSADRFTGWNLSLPVLGATIPSITLSTATQASLTVRVTAQRHGARHASRGSQQLGTTRRRQRSDANLFWPLVQPEVLHPREC